MANNFTFKDASGTTLTAKSTDASSVHIPANQVVDSSGNAPTDDGAATGPIYPVAGLYQALASVDEIDAGDVGRARVTARRAVVRAPDFRAVASSVTTVASAGDMEVSTSGWNTGYATPTTAFFDGADAGFGAGDRFVRVPMHNWSSVTFNLYQNLGVNLTVEIYAWISQIVYTGEGAGSNTVMLHTSTIANSGRILCTPLAGGSGVGASVITVAALAVPMSWLLLKLTPASDPSSGGIYMGFARRA